ncbi:hypothetical protein N5J54_06610 [Acinetobacter ursingii]|uniref:hypothetical protein n=1 Tax=Acinetobacter ursingii TaxID=108980 RepID=UPI0024474FDC|nr:hypothetical protein [Acinetobacter ursingii]MDH2103412.1 hypothetical protein [Acinetobacter ursingii]
MKTIEQKFTKTLQHSFLIFWKDKEQKWVVECPLLKVKLEADTYKDALDKLTLNLLRQSFHHNFFDQIEQDKKDFLKE